MLDEVSDYALDGHVDSFARQVLLEGIREDTELPADFGKDDKIEAATGVFEDIKVQFVSSRPHGPKRKASRGQRLQHLLDADFSWREQHLMRVRAIRRSSESGNSTSTE